MPISTNHSFFPYAVRGNPTYAGPDAANWSSDATSTTAVWYTEADGVSRLVYQLRERDGSDISTADFERLLGLTDLVKWTIGNNSYQAAIVDSDTTTKTISISIAANDARNVLPTSAITFAGQAIVGGLEDYPVELAGFDNDHIEIGYPVTTEIIAAASIEQGVTESAELKRIIVQRTKEMIPFIRAHVIQTTAVTNAMWPAFGTTERVGEPVLTVIPGVQADDNAGTAAIPDVPVYTVGVDVSGDAGRNISFDLTFANPVYTEMNVAKGTPSFSDVSTENAFTFTVTNESDAPINKNITEVVEVDNTHSTSTEIQKVFDVSNNWNVGINTTIGYGAPGISQGAFGSVSVNTAFGGQTNVSRTSTNSSSNEVGTRKTRTISDTVILQPLSLYQISATYRKATVSRSDTFRGNVDFTMGFHNLGSTHSPTRNAIGNSYVSARAATATYHGFNAASTTWRWAFGTNKDLLNLPISPTSTFPAGTMSSFTNLIGGHVISHRGWISGQVDQGAAIILDIPESAPEGDDGSWAKNVAAASSLVKGESFVVAGVTGAQASKYNGTWQVRDSIRVGNTWRIYITGDATRYNALADGDTIDVTAATIDVTHQAETTLHSTDGAGVSLRLSGASSMDEWFAAVMGIDSAIDRGDPTAFATQVGVWIPPSGESTNALREQLMQSWLTLKSSDLLGVTLNRDVVFTDATDVSLQVSKIASLFYGEINPDDATDDTTGYIPFQPTFSQSLIPTFSSNTQDVIDDANGGTAGNPGGTIQTPGSTNGINGDAPNVSTS